MVIDHLPPLLGFTVLPSAYFAVDLFFVLSGFVIASAYERPLTAGLSPRRFLLIRIVRLYPMYLVSVCVSGLAIAAALGAGIKFQGWNWTSLATVLPMQIFMLPAGGKDFSLLYPLNGPAYSLFYLVAANVVFAFCNRRLNVPACTVILAASAALLIAYLSRHTTMRGGHVWGTVGVGFLRVAYGFTAGLILAKMRHLIPRSRHTIPPFTILLGTVAIFALEPPGGSRGLYELLCVGLVMPTVVLASLAAAPTSSPRLSLALGDLSYPLYLIHVPVIMIATGVSGRLMHVSDTALMPWLGIILLVLLMPTAWLVGKFVDEPARRSLRRVLLY